LDWKKTVVFNVPGLNEVVPAFPWKSGQPPRVDQEIRTLPDPSGRTLKPVKVKGQHAGA